MTQTDADTVCLTLALNKLRLPTIMALWAQFAQLADKEGWPAARFLTALAEHELAERDRRRIERHFSHPHDPFRAVIFLSGLSCVSHRLCL